MLRGDPQRGDAPSHGFTGYIPNDPDMS
jgi:hypothetical protein